MALVGAGELGVEGLLDEGKHADDLFRQLFINALLEKGFVGGRDGVECFLDVVHILHGESGRSVP